MFCLWTETWNVCGAFQVSDLPGPEGIRLASLFLQRFQGIEFEKKRKVAPSSISSKWGKWASNSN